MPWPTRGAIDRPIAGCDDDGVPYSFNGGEYTEYYDAVTGNYVKADDEVYQEGLLKDATDPGSVDAGPPYTGLPETYLQHPEESGYQRKPAGLGRLGY